MLKHSVPQLSPSVVMDCELCVTFIGEMFILSCWCAWQNKWAFISVEVCVLCVYSSRIGLFSSWESTFRWDGGCLCVGSRAKCVCFGGRDVWTDGLWWMSAGVGTPFWCTDTNSAHGYVSTSNYQTRPLPPTEQQIKVSYTPLFLISINNNLSY